MVTFTPILKLAMPEFDHEPWDEEINGDMRIVDSAIGNFFGIANYVGLWKNSTAYTIGHVVTDTQNSSMWSCSVAHTSAAIPTTFAADRAARPTLWTQEIANAGDLAQQAANSAAAAAVSASAAAASAATINNALPLAGGTMTGFITLHSNPTNALHAATKQYVDGQVGGTSFLPLTGGGITGGLSVAGDFSVGGFSLLGYRVRAYTAGTNPVVFGYRDGFGGGGFFVNSDGSIYFSTFDGGGGATFHRAWVTPAGAFRAANNVAAPYLWSDSTVYWGNGASYLLSDGNLSRIQFQSDGWRLEFHRANGNLVYYNSASTNLFYINSSGLVTSAGGFTTPGDVWGNAVQSNWLRSFGSGQIDANFSVNGQTTLHGLVNANDIHSGAATIHNLAVSNHIGISNSLTCNGNATVVGSITTTALQNNSNINTASLSCAGGITCGSLSVSGAFGIGGTFSANHVVATVITSNTDLHVAGTAHIGLNIFLGNLAYKPGGGLWIDSSDERIKTVDGAYTSGLAELVQLNPVRFRYHRDMEREHIGLVAQQVENIMPEMVRQVEGVIAGETVNDLREMDSTPLLFAMLNAMKEINIRLTDVQERLSVLEANA